MIKYKLLLLMIYCSCQAFTQSNYQLIIDGQGFDVSLENEFTYITENGDSISFYLKQIGEQSQEPSLETEFAQIVSDKEFSDNFIEFQYPENFSIAVTRPTKSMQQITMVNGTGGGIILQEYATINPTELISFLLSGLVTQQQALAAQPINQTLANKSFSGLSTQDDEENTVQVLGYGKENKGLLIAFINYTEEDALLQSFLKSLILKF